MKRAISTPSLELKACMSTKASSSRCILPWPITTSLTQCKPVPLKQHVNTTCVSPIAH
ncbi:hypothetical protein BD779DRAFT_1539643 [Infundibulicybe gibba]|nr:hypothetical protein BD779DRAFT_1539643 [Infundibulicybe gibba]